VANPALFTRAEILIPSFCSSVKISSEAEKFDKSLAMTLTEMLNPDFNSSAT
jgi:hypothetical protein